MRINFSTSSVATSVWNNATRTLTTLVNNASPFRTLNSSIGAGVVKDLRPSVGLVRQVCFLADSATGFNAGIYDGTTFVAAVVAASSTYAAGWGVPTGGLSYKNSDAGAHNLTWCGWDWG